MSHRAMSKAPPPPSSDLLRQELNALEDAVAADREATAETVAPSTASMPVPSSVKTANAAPKDLRHPCDAVRPPRRPKRP